MQLRQTCEWPQIDLSLTGGADFLNLAGQIQGPRKKDNFYFTE